jgi:hypothetical protein
MLEGSITFARATYSRTYIYSGFKLLADPTAGVATLVAMSETRSRCTITKTAVR